MPLGIRMNWTRTTLESLLSLALSVLLVVLLRNPIMVLPPNLSKLTPFYHFSVDPKQTFRSWSCYCNSTSFKWVKVLLSFYIGQRRLRKRSSLKTMWLFWSIGLMSWMQSSHRSRRSLFQWVCFPVWQLEFCWRRCLIADVPFNLSSSGTKCSSSCGTRWGRFYCPALLESFKRFSICCQSVVSRIWQGGRSAMGPS